MLVTEKYKVKLKAGQSGDWRIEHMRLTKSDVMFHNLRCSIGNEGGPARMIPPGRYTRLMRGGIVVMSDTPAEIRDHFSIIHKAKEHVLINGLGLGMVVNAILAKPEVTHVTVVEKSPDVINLVGTQYKKRFGDKLTIIQADAYEYKPPCNVRYGAVWHDIWDDICADNIDGMKKLHAKYARRTKWQSSWARTIVDRNYREK